MKAIIYNRKSRGTEEELQKNKNEMIAYCKKNNFDYDYLEEIGSSVDEEREGYQKLLNLINTGKYQIIVVMELSRLTRSLKQQLELFDILTENGVIIHAVLDNDIIDPSNQMNEMMSIFKGTFNQMAYRETSKKMHLGRIQSAREGKFVNAPPFGYSKGPDMKLEIVEEEAAIVRRMFKLILKGHSITQIYRILYNEGIRTRDGHVFHDKTISKMLRNRAYLGEVIFESKKFDETVVVKNAHPAIISYEEFFKVQEETEKRKGFQERISKVLSPVDKLIYCKLCGRKMLISRGNSKNRSKYININKCRHFIGDERCPNGGSSIHLIMPTIYEQVEKRTHIIRQKLEELNQGKSDGSIELLQKEKKIVEKNILDKQKQKDKLLDVLLNGTINEVVFSKRDKQFESEIEALRQRVSDIETIILQRTIESDTERIEQLLDDLSQLQEKPIEEQNRILRNVIERIDYYRNKDHIEIDITFMD
ncbi:recombinase family protein [Lederbergia citri]|uniref:Recombinase family protein n=1 Tax=Lederbergia citri TaxID=2833580 RepID=A0A942TDP5_9BACI|nr:recombinase family protein [Lederbergia citri]MBS4194362.1 recombinase family protein [Lederbergia citri]